jgi:hypothetical protein
MTEVKNFAPKNFKNIKNLCCRFNLKQNLFSNSSRAVEQVCVKNEKIYFFSHSGKEKAVIFLTDLSKYLKKV